MDLRPHTGAIILPQAQRKGQCARGHTARKSNIRRGAEGKHGKSTDSEWVSLCLLVFQVVVSY